MNKMTLLALMIGTIGLLACGSSKGGALPAAPVVVTPSAGQAFPAGGVPSGWKLAWSDEFNVDGLPDATKWDFDTVRNRAGWHNNELQYYSRNRLKNARVADGKLAITALREN